MSKCLFLDLDNTLIRPTNGKKYPDSPKDWEPYPFMLDALLKEYTQWNYLIVVTNQGGAISRGYITEPQFINKWNDISNWYALHGIGFKDVFWSKFEGHELHKPFPGMAKLAEELYKIDLSKSMMVGDSLDDYNFAKNANIKLFEYTNDFINRVLYKPILK